MRAVAVAALLALASGAPAALSGQVIPTRPPTQQRQPDPADTIPVPPFRVEPPVSPIGAALRSLVLPGWGQAVSGRRVTGAVFVFWEGLTVMMTVKSLHQLDYKERIGEEGEGIDGKRSEIEDWAVLLAFNHILAAAEAYVATNLWDFPADITAEPLASGDVGMGLRFYW